MPLAWMACSLDAEVIGPMHLPILPAVATEVPGLVAGVPVGGNRRRTVPREGSDQPLRRRVGCCHAFPVGVRLVRRGHLGVDEVLPVDAAGDRRSPIGG